MNRIPRALALAAMLSLASMAAQAQSMSKPPLASPLSFDAAIASAVAEQPGEIVEIGLERADGTVVIEIEVLAASGAEHEFHLDPVSGVVLNQWRDDDPSDDPDGTSDADPDG